MTGITHVDIMNKLRIDIEARDWPGVVKVRDCHPDPHHIGYVTVEMGDRISGQAHAGIVIPASVLREPFAGTEIERRVAALAEATRRVRRTLDRKVR